MAATTEIITTFVVVCFSSSTLTSRPGALSELMRFSLGARNPEPGARPRWSAQDTISAPRTPPQPPPSPRGKTLFPPFQATLRGREHTFRPDAAGCQGVAMGGDVVCDGRRGRRGRGGAALRRLPRLLRVPPRARRGDRYLTARSRRRRQRRPGRRGRGPGRRVRAVLPDVGLAGAGSRLGPVRPLRRPGRPGLGVGRALLRAVADHARAAGATTAVLETAHTNTTAQALYESEGWVLDTTYRTYALTL